MSYTQLTVLIVVDNDHYHLCVLQIAMPRPVRSLSYNHSDGYIACGGDDGVLKAVKLDAKIG